MKWDSLTASARFVAIKFLKEKGLEPASTKMNVVTATTTLIKPLEGSSTHFFVRLVVILESSTTYRISAVIKRHGNSFRICPKTWTAGEAPPEVAPVRDTSEKKIAGDLEKYE